jgi:hypothetical protein
MSAAGPSQGANYAPFWGQRSGGSRKRGGPMSHAARHPWIGLVCSLAWVIAIGATAAALPPDVDLPAAEWKAIQGVISAQQTALKKDDGARAFAFATEGLRREFGTPERFMRMVHAGYQPLIDARYTEFLDGAVIDGVPVQPLRLVLPDNTVLVALYTMAKEDDGRWHIAGCAIAPSTTKAA